MSGEPFHTRSRALSVATFLILAFIFTVSSSPSPLYTSNQNQYFLHGLAHAGYEFLDRDWLVSTADPTPVFTWLVSATYFLKLEPLFYLYYAVLMGVFLYSVVGIATRVCDLTISKAKLLLYLTAIIGIESATLQFLGIRRSWVNIFQSGVAGQGLLVGEILPSTFGVFLFLSMYLFLQRKPYWAILVAAFTATVHPTYLLAAGVLCLTYVGVTFTEEKNLRRPVALALLALLSVIPILIYVATSFAPTTPELYARTQSILVEFRIPHHTLISHWWDSRVYVKLLLIVLALLLVRKTRLFPVILIAFLFSTALSVVQVVTGSDTLALLFPWRFSIFLVPLSTAIIVACIVATVFARLPDWNRQMRQGLTYLALASLVVFMAAGIIKFKRELDRRETLGERETESFVALNKRAQDMYLIPVEPPVYILENFRLETGAPVFVDFKSIPYKDVEVEEWYHRVQLASRFYQEQAPDVRCGLLQHLVQSYGITHVVMENGRDGLSCDATPLTPMHTDSHYRVYAVH